MQTTSLLCLLILFSLQAKSQSHSHVHVHNHNYKQMHKIKHIHKTPEPNHNTFTEEIETGGDANTMNNFSTSENYKAQMSKKTKIKHFKIPTKANNATNFYLAKNNNYKMPYSTRKKNTFVKTDSVWMANKLSE